MKTQQKDICYWRKQKNQPLPETELGDTLDTGHGASRGKLLRGVCLSHSASLACDGGQS